MKRSGWAALLCTAALTFACQTQPDAPVDEAPAAPTMDLASVKLRLEELKAQLSLDAYGQPEMEELIRALHAIPAGSPDYAEAQRLLAELRARYRLAKAARDDERHDSTPKAPSFGAVKMEGAPPDSEDARARAEGMKVGATREQLLEAYGSCLIRRTWFQGRDGSATIELFHVAPECRAQLKPRVFQVVAGTVARITDGNLDGLQAPTPSTLEVPRTPGGLQHLPPPPPPP